MHGDYVNFIRILDGQSLVGWDCSRSAIVEMRFVLGHCFLFDKEWNTFSGTFLKLRVEEKRQFGPEL